MATHNTTERCRPTGARPLLTFPHPGVLEQIEAG